MATLSSPFEQQTSEVHTYTVDFTDDLPTGGTVTAGTATHTPPSGSSSSVTVTASSPYLYVTFPAQSVIGLHYIDALATFNNGDKSSVRIPVNVVYPASTARSGMLNLITELRSMTEAGAADYSIASSVYWSDKHLQDILDLHRTDVIFQPLQMYPTTVAGGSSSYQDYRYPLGMLEETTGGTAIFYVQDSTGATVGSASYTPDYRRGQVLFNSNQAGTVYYLTARSYDLNSAAADVWRKKAAHVAPTSFDFSTDNHSISRSQVYSHCLEMADFFESKSNNSITSVSMWRSDVN